MEEVVFCEGCHRALSPDYHFCPYCGRDQSARTTRSEAEQGAPLHDEVATFEEIVEESLDRMQESVREYTVRRLEEFAQALNRMESELDDILALPHSDDAARAVSATDETPAEMKMSAAKTPQSMDEHR